MKILIAEDDPVSLRLLALNLKSAGHEVVQAENGMQAWEIWQKERLQVVITDWMMPEMSGMDLIRKIRETGGGSTYIIVVTVVGEKPRMVAGITAGANYYVTKPYDPDELLARLNLGRRILALEENLSTSRRQMEFLAMHDALTGLFNRRAIHERAEADLSRAIREHRPLSVALIDMNHFKLVNDQYGHHIGDQALRLVAEVLNLAIRAYDAVGRWGGEEFFVLLPGATLAEAAVVAERIRHDVTEITLKSEQGARLLLTVSLGVATLRYSSEPVLTLDQLGHEADEALYRAKNEGRNRVCLGAEKESR